MKTKLDIENQLIISWLQKNYNINAVKLDFIPKGDISYAYIATAKDGNRYFLKLFDKYTPTGMGSISLLEFYMPLTWHLYHKALYKFITYPIKTRRNSFQTDLGPAVMAVFNFIDGRTLEDEYPFSRLLLEKVAGAMARIHQADCEPTADNIRVEDFQISFEDDLLIILDRLENTKELNSLKTLAHKSLHNEDIEALRQYILPRKNKILNFLNGLKSYQTAAKGSTKKMVLTHGDLWGGNMMLDSSSNLYLIDWESAMFAPAEADLRHYVFEEFDYFMENYDKHFHKPESLDFNVLGFYIYKSHLANLTNWMSRILYNNQSREQNASDLECISLHCMDRWDGIEERIEELHSIFS